MRCPWQKDEPAMGQSLSPLLRPGLRNDEIATAADHQGGDIDGRIKTLLDALTMPQHKEQMADDHGPPDLIHCLLEEDSMVSGLSVETERLLGATEAKDYVKLTIEVDVRVRFPALYNQAFLG